MYVAIVEVECLVLSIGDDWYFLNHGWSATGDHLNLLSGRHFCCHCTYFTAGDFIFLQIMKVSIS